MKDDPGWAVGIPSPYQAEWKEGERGRGRGFGGRELLMAVCGRCELLVGVWVVMVALVFRYRRFPFV